MPWVRKEGLSGCHGADCLAGCDSVGPCKSVSLPVQMPLWQITPNLRVLISSRKNWVIGPAVRKAWHSKVEQSLTHWKLREWCWDTHGGQEDAGLGVARCQLTEQVVAKIRGCGSQLGAWRGKKVNHLFLTFRIHCICLCKEWKVTDSVMTKEEKASEESYEVLTNWACDRERRLHKPNKWTTVLILINTKIEALNLWWWLHVLWQMKNLQIFFGNASTKTQEILTVLLIIWKINK